MKTYFFPIQAALISFPIIAFLLVLPYTIISYRKHGRFSYWRAFLLFSFIFYLQCAYFLVVLPLPDPKNMGVAAGYNVIPFSFIYEMITKAPRGINFFSSVFFLEPVFNVFLTIPFGIFLAFYSKMDIKKVIFCSFLLSLFFELTQLSGLYGIYPHAYRSFDVNDLILNTIGGGIGFYFKGIIPNIKTKAPQTTISYSRRAVAFLIDNIFISFLTYYLGFFIRGISQEHLLIITFFAYFYILSFIWNGETIGKSIVKIRIYSNTRLGLFFRFTIRNSYYFLIITANNKIKEAEKTEYLFYFLIICLFIGLFDYISSFKHNKQLWYERITKTQTIGTNS